MSTSLAINMQTSVSSLLSLFTAILILPLSISGRYYHHKNHPLNHEKSTIHNDDNNDNDVQIDNEYTTIYSSCNEIEVDGMYYIKPDPNLPALPVICSNGYVMLDGSLDSEMKTYPNFLSSHDYGRFNKFYTISGLDDLSTYREWLLFADQDTKFNIAPGCMSCGSGQYDDNTVYYIDSHTYCFSGAITTGCIEDTGSFNYHSESCNQCDVGVWPDDDLSQHWTKCMALQLDADHPINHEHISCVAHGLTFHPVISNVRDACTCYQPLEEEGVTSYQVPISELPLVTARHDQYVKYGFYVADNIQFDPSYGQNEVDPIDNRENNIVYLYNSDFVDGTYRIKESGTYVIMEDIVFNFNAPTDEEMNDPDFSPNSIDVDELYWYPTHEQATINGEYPGLYTYSGAFTLGFFAGITIETDYVTIDLNGFTLSQHPLFYFQQRFFALIELASQPFVPGQGPANWGAGTDVYANYVEIKNGNLGLTSHHSIHGNNNDFITITNVNAGHFDVAGMQCNSCTNVMISDCIIGPQNDNIPLLGRYTHSRAFLPRLKQLMDEHGDEEITFFNREPMLISDIIYRLINQMDMIYHYINNNDDNSVIYDDDDEDWIAAQKLFYNPSGWMDGGSSYGLLIGGDGAQVVGIGARVGGTSDVTISNVEIYGIYNKVIEKIKYTANFGATRMIFFDAIDWNAVSDQILEPKDAVYLGDAYTDVTMAISAVVDSWYFMNSLYVSDPMTNYVFNGDSALGVFHGGCGSDIQLHSSKGSIGLRVDGTQNINIDNVYIHDIYNWADLGNQEWCGQYEGPNVGNEDIEIQYGYTGTRSHGLILDYATGNLANIKIENVESFHGEANGITIYKECDINLENIVVDNIHAGTQLNDEQILNEIDLPNLIPRACGVDIRPNTQVTINQDTGIIAGDDIIGFQTCYDEDTDDDELFINKRSIIIDNHSKVQSTTMIIMITVVITVGIIILFWYHCIVKIGNDKNNDLLYDDKSEYTPLL